jgi:16S rRNA (uracil1498-N3)-methyltransferase
VAEEDADRKSGKWQRVALEACKQCGQDLIPQVEAAADFSDWLGRAGEGGLKIIASLYPGTLPLKEILHAAGSPEAVTLLVGPEGDFTSEEAAAAVAAGFQPATLGPIVLRAETAAFFGISALRYAFT